MIGVIQLKEVVECESSVATCAQSRWWNVCRSLALSQLITSRSRLIGTQHQISWTIFANLLFGWLHFWAYLTYPKGISSLLEHLPQTQTTWIYCSIESHLNCRLCNRRTTPRVSDHHDMFPFIDIPTSSPSIKKTQRGRNFLSRINCLSPEPLSLSTHGNTSLLKVLNDGRGSIIS